MRKQIKYSGIALASWLMMAMAGGAVALAAPEAKTTAGQGVLAGYANGAQISLRWELVRTVFTPEAPGGGTQARLILSNLGQRPLPARGWTLYFNVMDGVATGPLDGNLLLEQVAGNLYCIRPAPGFAGVPAGQTLSIAYYHPDLVIKLAKAPAGPYLVYDAAPDVGQAIADYQLLPVTRPEQLDKGSSGAKPVVTAQDIYRRNAKADWMPAAALPPVFPTPQHLQTSGGKLQLVALPKVVAPVALKTEAAIARSLFPASLPAAGPNAPTLRLSVGAVAGSTSPEAYTLTIKNGIDIVGNSAAGVAYGLQSLRDLLPLPGVASIELPEVTISDAPRFEYRGFQLDVGRNFHTKQTVFKLLDLMARYKLNKFHFHLTEDEGWRLEIAGLPELTSIGAVRGHSAKPGVRMQPAYGSGPDPLDASGSGYYTRAEYIEILCYAAARHIEVIPEIEMPGHARAAVKSMEARYHRLKAEGKSDAARYLLNDLADKSVYKSAQLYNDHVINPGLESSFTFIDHVITQVAGMYKEAGVPLHTIHVGGDELPGGAWEQSPASRTVMQKKKLESTAELWDYFYDRVDAILRKHCLYASGWEELAARGTKVHGEHKLIPNPHFTQRGFSAYVWNNTEGAEDFAYRLANAGYDVVLAPVTKMYMDMAYNANPDEPGVNWGDYVELDTVYDFIPLDYLKNANPPLVGKDSLTDYGKRRVRGLEATLFTETVRTPERIDYLIMPRLLAMAERSWAPDPDWATEPDAGKAAALHRSAWSGFVNTLSQRVLPRLDLEHAGVDYRIAPPGLLLDGGRVLVNHVLPGIAMRYTSDGSEPNTSSKPVNGPISDKGQIKVAAFDRNGRVGAVSHIDNH
ncbi:family 20 glycosylhydrolase [Duganella violaceipulchra]|uniref:beta-N-acetylhexosaminidase n=1 Tax=Duganella violaceipulchra TaxID=2849652 RepID=A0AA41HFK3_9BURK|nr:family 20 glycosylhydrolase [Duganella violaceicalia]MBV6323584.1 carbohydate-binding domain-containing protein [Duganella violaceicalia]MCP2008939.1 hexosaminidase [Duganella violaceicalia]